MKSFSAIFTQKAEMVTTPTPMNSQSPKALKPFYRWENQDKGIVKALSSLDYKQLASMKPLCGASLQIPLSFLRMSHLPSIPVSHIST